MTPLPNPNAGQDYYARLAQMEMRTTIPFATHPTCAEWVEIQGNFTVTQESGFLSRIHWAEYEQGPEK